MYQILLSTHSILRWVVLLALIYAVIRGFSGMSGNKKYTKADNGARIMALVSGHIQFLVGFALYFVSPIVQSYWSGGSKSFGVSYFAFMHNIGMILAVVLLTVGSAKSKRAATDQKKFSTMAIFFVIALLLILASIPWPFMGEAGRPLIRF